MHSEEFMTNYLLTLAVNPIFRLHCILILIFFSGILLRNEDGNQWLLGDFYGQLHLWRIHYCDEILKFERLPSDF